MLVFHFVSYCSAGGDLFLFLAAARADGEISCCKRGARRLFDGMPPGSRKIEIASAESDRDRISALPDEAIHHVLGFLPAGEAVRTSLLARGWHHHWRFMHSLYIRASVGFTMPWYRLMALTRLIERLLLNCHVPLDECHINIYGLMIILDGLEDLETIGASSSTGGR